VFFAALALASRWKGLPDTRDPEFSLGRLLAPRAPRRHPGR
jgi:hypothetical protein